MADSVQAIVISPLTLRREAMVLLVSGCGLCGPKGLATVDEAISYLSRPKRGRTLVLLDNPEYTPIDVEQICRIKTSAPDAKIVVLAEDLPFHYSELLQDVGVEAIVWVDVPRVVLCHYLELVVLGERFFDTRATQDKASYAMAPSHTKAPALPALTARERDVVALVADGISNKIIAKKLAVTDGTVKTHLRNLFRKLGLRNRTQLAAWAVEGVRSDQNEPRKRFCAKIL